MKTNSTEKFSASLVRTLAAQFAHTINLASDHKQWRFSFFYSKQKTIDSFLIPWVQCFHSIEDKKKPRSELGKLVITPKYKNRCCYRSTIQTRNTGVKCNEKDHKHRCWLSRIDYMNFNSTKREKKGHHCIAK